MYKFNELISHFGNKFRDFHFPESPGNLYQPNDYFIALGGKRIRPVLCLLGTQLYGNICEDAYTVATAIELFHNFTLIHDDIMDNADLRRGNETVHKRYGANTAILSGDVMLIRAYELLATINPAKLPEVLRLFNQTAKEVCEGQQLDMDFEKQANVSREEYIKMIGLKTSVLIAASLEIGAILNDASEEDRQNLYNFGLNLGIAFQIQDDYLDAFGDPTKFGKTVGGDIKQNKKTILLIEALARVAGEDKALLYNLLSTDNQGKVESVLTIYKKYEIDSWTKGLIKEYLALAMQCLANVSVSEEHKQPLHELANYLIERES